MITQAWTIATCKHEIATGGVTVAHWRCNVADIITAGTALSFNFSYLTA